MNEQLAIAEVLERAADLIFTDGWIQESMGERGGPRCARGHLISAANERRMVQNVVIGAVSNAIFPNLVCWNDMPGRTAGEVRDLFLTVAKDIRNEAT